MTTCPFCTSSLPVNAATCPTCGASLTSPALEFGAIIGDKYKVERVLGQGGFGITYLVLDTELNHRVAIKELFVDGSTRRDGNVIPPQGMDFAQTKAKFLEEAQTVQRFNDDGIVRVCGVFEGNQTAYMVMEALNGSTLTAKVMKDGAFPPKKVLELARQLCAALEIVHKANLLHRDIKPDNVFLTSDGRVVLIDFGSARGFAQGQVKRLTRLVTPGYAAPEQYASQAAFGTYTDVYGLAATLYYAVEGQMPPMATDLMLGARLEFRKAEQLQAGLEAGLRVKVDERPQTVKALLGLLEQAFVKPRVTVAAPMIAAKSAKISALLYDRNGISISLDEITVQGKAFSIPFSRIKGYSLSTEYKYSWLNNFILFTWEFNAIFLIAALISYISDLEGFQENKGLSYSNPFQVIFGSIIILFIAILIIAFFFFNSPIINTITLSTLVFLIVSFVYIFTTFRLADPTKIFKFGLIIKKKQKNYTRHLDLFKTENLKESIELEQALLQVIPKIP